MLLLDEALYMLLLCLPRWGIVCKIIQRNVEFVFWWSWQISSLLSLSFCPTIITLIYLLTFLPSSLSTYQPSQPLTYLPTHSPTHQPACPLTALLPCWPTYLPTYLPTVLTNYPQTFLPIYFFTNSPTHLLTYLPPYLPTNLPTYFLTYLLTHPPIYLNPCPSTNLPTYLQKYLHKHFLFSYICPQLPNCSTSYLPNFSPNPPNYLPTY